MGSRKRNNTIYLWANGDYAGHQTVKASGDSELQYDAAWCKSTRGRPISLSLPFNLHNEQLKEDPISHYFDGLLPDSDAIRKRVAVRFKTDSTDAFDLLAAIGRDCVGALQLLPEGVEPEGLGRVGGIVVDEEAIKRHLLDVVNPGHYGATQDADDDFRISLAGAQEKDAFLWWNGKWLKPRGATPTAHIFKLPTGLVDGQKADFSTSVDNEWLCLGCSSNTACQRRTRRSRHSARNGCSSSSVSTGHCRAMGSSYSGWSRRTFAKRRGPRR